MTGPHASLIISTWNGRHLLETCLPSVLRAVERAGGGHEVIVVDDASSDDTVEYVQREFPQVRLIALARNLRFAGANNAAAQAARGDVLVFLNNDMLVEPDFLSPLLRHFNDPVVFAVTARIEMPPKRVSGTTVRETGLVRARFEEGFFDLRHEEPISDAPVQVMYAGGGSSAYQRDRFLQLGSFDRLFRPFYFEDLDVTYRAQKMGWRLLFEPRSRMVHKHRQTNSPRNFPSGYVDLMFGKNLLLFTWKVLTDADMLRAHFTSLWRRLMRPSENPRLAAFFLRASVQLPELLLKRHRCRDHAILSDREVIQRSSARPLLEAAEGGRVDWGSEGTGRRILVVGFSPLPFERERALPALGFRTWHLVQALLADNHEVTVVGCRVGGAYEEEARRPRVLRFTGPHFTYYSVARSAFETGELLPRICDEARPEAVVAVDAYGAWAASRTNAEAPLWVDLSSHAVAEAQARAALAGEDAQVAEAWEWERAALMHADAFSVGSVRQKYALIGELAAHGRLTGSSYGRDIVHYMPDAIEDRPYRHRRRVLRGRLVEQDDFVVLWSGDYDARADIDTLFEGIIAAMREEPRIRFVSIGGAVPEEDDKTFHRFRQRAEESEFADRFAFAGWVPTEEVPNYYFESDVGINSDRLSYATLLGARYRILDMLRAGLPVITTLGDEISHVVQSERLGLTFAPGDAAGLKEAVLRMARDEALRRRCAERAKDYVFKQRTVERTMMPLRRWAEHPARDPSRPASGELDPWPLMHRIAGREGVAPRAGVRGLARAAAGRLAHLAAKAVVRRRGIEPWGLDPREPPQRALIIRGGSLGLTREVVERIRGRYPAAQVWVLAPESLAIETRHETEAAMLTAPGAGLVSYRLSRTLVSELRSKRFDTILVAGEGNRRAELLALLGGAERRVQVREDGAAHTFAPAPHKPLVLLISLMAGILEKITLSALVALVWSSIHVEGRIRRLRRRAAALAKPG